MKNTELTEALSNMIILAELFYTHQKEQFVATDGGEYITHMREMIDIAKAQLEKYSPAKPDVAELPSWFSPVWSILIKSGKFSETDKIRKADNTLYTDVKKFILWYEGLREGKITTLPDYAYLNITRKNIPSFSEDAILDALLNCTMTIKGSPGKAMVTYTRATRYSPVLNYLLRHPPMVGNITPVEWPESKEWTYDHLEADGVPVRDNMILGFIEKAKEYVEDNSAYIKQNQEARHTGECLAPSQLFTAFMVALRENKWDYRTAIESVSIGARPKKNMYWDETLKEAYKKYGVKMGHCSGFAY